MKHISTTYEPVIGLEIHAQLLTASKMFCGCSAIFGSQQNTQTCPVCLGLPGALPVPNRKAFEFAIKMGLAAHCTISSNAIFARKNYFYPDLPKGYQISQYEHPICRNGFLSIEIENRLRKIGITRIHIEEDAGKSIHEVDAASEVTLVDLNRCGVPLIEIVTEPDIRSPREALLFLQKLRRTLLYLKICDGNMEEASLRCDANISVRKSGSEILGQKTELKNLNSFHAVEKALNYEFHRQERLLQTGKTVTHATLLWDEKANKAIPMRFKEEASEYRYFPEPDLVPVTVDQNWIENIRSNLPELPEDKKIRFMKEYKLPENHASILTNSRDLADFFEAVAEKVSDAKLAGNWILTEILRALKSEEHLGRPQVSSDHLARLLCLLKEKTITRTIAKQVFNDMLISGKEPEQILEENKLAQINDTETIGSIIDKVLSNHPKEVARYRNGEQKLLGFFIGQLMTETKGQANPQRVHEILRQKLETG